MPQITQNYTKHGELYLTSSAAKQRGINPSDCLSSNLPVVSIAPGKTFILLEVVSEDALSKLVPFPSPIDLPKGYIGAWEQQAKAPAYAFYCDDKNIRARLFHGAGEEEAATESAAAALALYLATETGEEGEWEIIQGVEMNRKNTFTVTVDREGAGLIVNVEVEEAPIPVEEPVVEEPVEEESKEDEEEDGVKEETTEETKKIEEEDEDAEKPATEKKEDVEA
jgi:predicted PhzF superfamily epimerase YddE/YHI9